MALPVRLSVVIPNYNHARYLPRVLDSLLSQSRQPAEILVLDDASTDNSRELLAGYAALHPHIRVLHNQQNQGVIRTVFLLFEAMTGTHVFGLGADDFVLPGFFEAALAQLEARPEAGVCFCDSEMVSEAGLGLGLQSLNAAAGYFEPEQLCSLMARNYVPLVGSNTIISRAALHEVGTLQADARWAMDWLYCTVSALRHGACYVPGSYTRFRIAPESFSGQGARTPEHRKVLKFLLDLFDQPEFASICPLVARGAVLSCFAYPVTGLMLSERRYWKYLSWPLLRRAVQPYCSMLLERVFPGLRRSLKALRDRRRARPPKVQ